MPIIFSDFVQGFTVPCTNWRQSSIYFLLCCSPELLIYLTRRIPGDLRCWLEIY
uniref:Uncharacterized protein n=1 Tax=Arundo donax TaxID=35708 RepID=A0A0A9BH68_ARUDO